MVSISFDRNIGTFSSPVADLEDSIENGLTITAITTQIFFCSNCSKPEATKSVCRCQGIMKVAGGICGISEKLCSSQELD